MLYRNNLHKYQQDVISFADKNKNFGLFLDMGLGKTISSLTIIDNLLNSFSVNKILIIAPLRVANTVWHVEADNWSHTKAMNFSIVTGSKNDRLVALNRDAEVYVINRENVPWLVDYYKNKWPFDMLIIDESSSFKNPTSKRFRALKKILKYVDRTIILTGTPAPKGYIDLWSQIYILDQGERLGKTITAYRNKYFDSDFMGYSYKLKAGAKELIDNAIRDIIISMSSENYLDLPDAVSIIKDTPLDKKLLKMYKEFESTMLLSINDEVIDAVNAAVLTNKLLQFSSGIVYDDKGDMQVIHDLKFDAFDELLEENPDEPMLIAYNFKHERLRFLQKYPDTVVFDGKNDDKVVKDWNAGKIKKLLVHPASAGHGLNLQKGGSIAVWFGFNWSLELYQQFNKRLHRQGQKNVVRIVHLAVGDVEYRLMRSLKNKDITQASLLEALKYEN